MKLTTNPTSFEHVEMAPRDPILGLTEAFNADSNPRKVNLGVGIYYDAAGKVPLLECVQRAERQMADSPSSRAYLPIDGIAAYDKAVRNLVFKPDSIGVEAERIVTVQALGGTGGLKIGADFLKRLSPEAEVWISDPSWENHRALFENAGFTVRNYPYYDPQSHGLRFQAIIDGLNEAPTGTIVVLHACCHNPTGVDLSNDQWAKVINVVKERQLIPFLDLAYQGFGDGIDADAKSVRDFTASGSALLVSSSFSKSFSLYGERIGSLSIVTGSASEAARVLSQLKRIIRTNYSNPPTHGGQIVATVLSNPELRDLWERELATMRDRIKKMREALVAKLKVSAPKHDFSFVKDQRGMFSYSGLDKSSVMRLREKFGVYAVDTGRICVAALNDGNIDYVAESIAASLN